MCIVGTVEATRINADRRQPWTTESTWHFMVKHAELKQRGAKAATMADSNRLVKTAARADWLTGLEEATKEATAAARADWLTGLEEATKEATAAARADWLTGLEEAMK